MNELQIFKNNEFGEIRTVTKNNEPWFIATDVCSALDISNTSQALTRLDDDEKNTIILNEGIGNPNKSIVSEYGLYNLILASRKKEAKKFKRWITHEVIPTIRKHGAYMSSEVIEKTLSDPDYLIRLATNLKEEKAKRALAEAQIERDKPKVLFADSCEVAENSILIGEFAKRLKQNGYNIGQNKLFEWLRQHDYLCKSGERKNLPTQYSMERGLFEVKTRIVSNPNGSVRTTSTTKVTGKGQIYFTNKFLRA
ncbi:phage antirepressor KilAC domain-containing protein [Finegoldia magna]|uniref:phage antirepressor KilAC domain-containing protein n=1 Tax=Finegoldia magna TaxID=1260 RepID=UPI000B91CCC7|nr:phage antirepressor [Finegoldia magna]OXZ40013.1 phage antirepressor Ant [Finegoldia magna]